MRAQTPFRKDKEADTEPKTKTTCSVIVPMLDARRESVRCLDDPQLRRPDTEIIICEASGREDIAEDPKFKGVKVFRCGRGRGLQLNHAARKAKGSILIFLHADTVLPADAFQRIDEVFRDPGVQVGTFRLKFDFDHWILRFYGFMTRFDSVLTSFGDQGIVVRRGFFRLVGGFPDWPLFEDVRFLQEARKRTRIRTFPVEVITSAEKFRKNGYIRQQLKNAYLIFLYYLGVKPARLYRMYYR